MKTFKRIQNFLRRGRRWQAAGFVFAALIGGAGLIALAPTRSLAQDIATSNVRLGETEAGNLIADAVRAAGNAEIGFVPAAAFRPNLHVARPATADDATRLVDPPGDTIVVLTLRGDQILDALERSVSFAPQSSAGFLQVSGLKFTYNQRAAQKRVQNVTVGGQPLEATRKYKVATTKPLANGQQGYHAIWDRDAITTDTAKSLATALGDLARARGGTLSPSVEGRITQTGN